MRRTLSVVALTASSIVVGLTASPATVHALPAGFTDTVVANPGGNPLSQPTTIVALPGARALILEKGGHVRVLLANGLISPDDALTLNVCTGSEMGLIGAAVDPNFALNGYVYLYYTTGANCASSTGRFNRVSRFVMSGDSISAASETVLLTNIAAYGGNHDGGALEVGQDGYLYVGVGDSGINPRAPHGGASANTAATDMSLLNGKIVRITTTGGIPADNPFANAPNGVSCAAAGTTTAITSACQEIYAWGLRNPYRTAFDPNAGTTRFFINDVGQNAWEEVDEGGLGRNYGWNGREAGCATGSTTNCPVPAAGLTDPITAYAHDGVCEYITAGAFVPNGIWPAEYDGSYLFADGGCGKMWRRTVAGTVDYANPFAQTVGGIVDMEFIAQGADPALYYVAYGSNQVRKITYDAPPAVASNALGYSAHAAPSRVYDTRNNIGVAAGRVRAGTSRLVNVGLSDQLVKAVLVNLTQFEAVGEGFVVAYQPRTEHPPTSNLNALSAETVANASIVPVDPSGNIIVYSSVTADVIVDVLGEFRATAPNVVGGRYHALSPLRLIDTRTVSNGTDNRYSRSNVGSTVDVVAPVANLLKVPGNATSVAVILTAISLSVPVPGFATVYLGGTTLPPSSNINVNGSGDTRANLVVVPLGADGTLAVHLVNVAHLLIDVAGYFADGDTASGMYTVLAPTRQVDTRAPIGFGPLSSLSTNTLNPSGGVPDEAIAVTQNLTVTQTGADGFITAYPSDEARPEASNLNATGPDQTRAALAFSKVGANGAGSVAYFSAGPTQFIVDITGYFQG